MSETGSTTKQNGSRVCFFVIVKHSGNLNFDDIIAIARQMRPRSMAKQLSGTVKEVLGKSQFIFDWHMVFWGTWPKHGLFLKAKCLNN